ncbi:MAG TPA: tRNA (N6-isopentenyl adenosine(37)-C2)-methylthiotransferase MiaB [Acidimicrobiales bacterium]|nr:tRNA (N6-isopentenyl adenosine(37)-C2)-methylthiotransferase MiaB [Acidimicrobiales bacterium]
MHTTPAVETIPTVEPSEPVGGHPAARVRTFHIQTFGCQMNEHDSERLAGALVADGMVATPDLESADVVVFNTCCIRENADNKFYGHLGDLKMLRESRPDMQIAVGGCLAQMDKDRIRQRASHVDVVFGTHNLTHAPELLRRAAASGPVVEVLDEPMASTDPTATDQQEAALAAVRDLPYAAWVTIQTGCNNSCAFCIVPSVRGGEVSRGMNDLVSEVETLAGRGVTEVTLLGQNVNSYGRDLTRRRPLFAELLRKVGAVEGIRRVRFTSPHPKDLGPETIAAMAETDEVCNHLHLPLQSGSDAILSSMRRGYRADRYLSRLAAARVAVPDLAVTTDLIVGFPGETEDDFERTLEVAASASFDSAYTFIFSPRPGTRAAAMADRFVPSDVIAERFDRLRTVIERSALIRHRDRVGRVEEVVVEGPSKRNADVVTGRTGQNKLVHFTPIDGHRVATGSYAQVMVTAAARHHLTGDLLAVTARPSHRVRIPVSSG